MKKEELPVTNMVVLLEIMSRGFMSHKTGAALHRVRSSPPETYIEEVFDDGHGHSNAVTKKRTPITEELFQRVVRERFVEGVLEPGYVSQTKFVLSLQGRDVYVVKQRLVQLAREKLHRGRFIRACDLQHLGVSVEEATEILDYLVACREAEPSG